jgi:hypothetical protein
LGIRIMDIKTNRDLIAPPPQTEMFVGTGLTKKMSVAFMDLHAEHAAMQLKAFTKWWDSWLKPRGTEVTDLCEQIKDGVIAIKLIEALSGCKAAYARIKIHCSQLRCIRVLPHEHRLH